MLTTYNRRPVSAYHRTWRQISPFIGPGIVAAASAGGKSLYNLFSGYKRVNAFGDRGRSAKRQKTGDRLSEKMPSRMNHSFQGRTMILPRGIRERAPKYLCCTKDSTFDTVNSSVVFRDAIYLAVGTHPPKKVLLHLCASLTLHFMKQIGVHCRSMNQNLFELLSGDQLVINYRYHTRERVASSSVTVVPTADTTLWFVATTWANSILGVCDQFSNSFKIDLAQFWVRDSTTTTILYGGRREYDLTRAHVTIASRNRVYFQNQTASSTGQADDSNIFRNPLHGKVYYYNGLSPIGNWGTELVNQFPFKCDATTGVFSNHGGGTGIPAQIQDDLESVPHPTMFRNVTRHANIEISPGDIMNMSVNKTETRSFNQWIALLRPWLMSGNALDSVEAAAGSISGGPQGRIDFHAGRGAMIALEKVCNLGSAQVPAIAFEKKSMYMSNIWFKRDRFVAASNIALVPNNPA